MLRECLDVFEKIMEESGDKIITDAYLPKNGTYRLVEINDMEFRTIKTLEISYDKKKDIVTGSMDTDFSFISILDYYSKLVDMNKPVDSKVIHTNNFLSFGVKKKSIKNNDLTDDLIKKYYEILKKPEVKYLNKKGTKLLYDNMDDELEKPDAYLIERICHYMIEENTWDGIDLNKKEDYVKIFFVFADRKETKDYFRRENERYLIPKIYNTNDFNRLTNGEVYGLSNNNMNMNGKKPYLKNKTRKVSVPNLISQKQALIQNQMFDYFMTQVSKGKINFYINNDEEEPEIKAYTNTEEPKFLQSGYYLRMKKDKNEVSIEQADVIVDYNPDLKKSFVLTNYFDLQEKILEKFKDQYEKNCHKLWEIKGVLDDAFFEGKFRYGFDRDIKDLSFSSHIIKQGFLLCREQLMNWFWQGIDTYICEILDDVTLRLIKVSIAGDKISFAQHQFNVRWSLLNYFDENRKVGENMSHVRKELREHINLPGNEDWDFSSDDEFAYAVGQTVSYLLSLSKTKDKDQSCINVFLDAKNVKIIKEKLLQLYKKYNYRIIHHKSGRFGRMTAAIMEYEPKYINSEMIMAGFVTAPLIYEKKND